MGCLLRLNGYRLFGGELARPLRTTAREGSVETPFSYLVSALTSDYPGVLVVRLAE